MTFLEALKQVSETGEKSMACSPLLPGDGIMHHQTWGWMWNSSGNRPTLMNKEILFGDWTVEDRPHV
jgi:hypothetical protein